MVTTAYELGNAYDLSRKELVFCSATDPVREIARDFRSKRIGSMIVKSDQGYAGIITDDTIFRAVADGVDLRQAKVKDLKLDPLHTVPKEAPLAEVSRKFAETCATRLGVVDERGEVVAVVKKKNLELLERFSFVDRASRLRVQK